MPRISNFSSRAQKKHRENGMVLRTQGAKSVSKMGSGAPGARCGPSSSGPIYIPWPHFGALGMKSTLGRRWCTRSGVQSIGCRPAPVVILVGFGQPLLVDRPGGQGEIVIGVSIGDRDLERISGILSAAAGLTHLRLPQKSRVWEHVTEKCCIRSSNTPRPNLSAREARAWF